MEFFVSVFTCVVCIGIALVVYAKNSKSDTNIYFSSLLCFLGLYSLFNYFSTNAVSNNDAFLWAKFVLYSLIPIGPLLFLFVKSFPSAKSSVRPFTKLILSVWMIINLTFAYLNLIFSSVVINEGAIHITQGPAIVSFIALHVGSIAVAAFSLVKKYRHSTGIIKLQLRYVTWGIITSFTLTIFVTFILGVLLNITVFIPLSPLFLLIGAIAIAYAIIRHRLLDIRTIVVRTVTYFLLTLVTAILYVAGFFILGRILSEDQSVENQFLISIILSLGLVFSFQPLRRTIENGTDKLFFRAQYDSQSALRYLGKIIAENLDIRILCQALLKALSSLVKMEYITIVLFGNSRIIWSQTEGKNEQITFDEAGILSLVEYTTAKNEEHFLIAEELSEGELKDEMKRNRAVLFFPLIFEKKAIGALLIGHKSTGDTYSLQDINLLRIVSPEIGVAIRNALSYDEIKRFNATLQQEVEKATSNLKLANNQLKELDKIKDEFVYMASHELRTPMTAIKNYLWLVLNKHKDRLNDEMKTDLNRAYISTERLIGLVQDMLTVSRIEGKRLVFDLKPLRIMEAAQQIIDELGVTAREKQLNLTLVPTSEQFLVYADQTKIMEVIQNLIGNSLKFTPAGGSITVSIRKKDGMIETNVSDTGVGIPQEDLPRLFQKFGRLGHSYKRMTGETGTGLGLFISKQIIDAHGGTIWATSEVDHGSTFTFSLPEYKEAPTAVNSQAPTASEEGLTKTA